MKLNKLAFTDVWFDRTIGQDITISKVWNPNYVLMHITNKKYVLLCFIFIVMEYELYL